jgi:ubiquinone/menaquinone biosynthesis C-methylase UbiE
MTLEISRLEMRNAPPPSRNPAGVLSKGPHVAGCRPRTRIPLVNLSPGIREANSLFESGRFLEAFDVYEQLVVAHPEHSIELLAELYDLYQALPNREDRYTLYQARLFDFGISPSDKVLDVGSGNIPFPLATHLADLSPDDDQYGRAGAPFKRIDGKPVYVCNIENLNCFADKEFDFVYCSHVLEHVRNPEKACSELSRIGKRGYVETPTRGKDLWLNTAKISNHLWSVESYQSKLVFTEYRPEETDGLQNDLLMKMHVRPETPREKALTSLLYLKADLVNTMLLWEDKLECEVRRSFPFGSPIDRAPKLKASHSGPVTSSTQQLKIYADRSYLPPGTKHTPLLVPLWGDIDSEGDPDWLRFKNYHSAGQEYFVQSGATDADIVILPGDFHMPARRAQAGRGHGWMLQTLCHLL